MKFGDSPRQRPRAVAIIVAAGRGERFGAPDKVFRPLAGIPLIGYALDAVERASSIQDVVLVVGSHTLDRAKKLVASSHWSKVTRIVIGGERRQDSVAAGLAVLPGDADLVALHDGARPFAPPALFDACLKAAARSGAAIAAMPMSDTIKRVSSGKIVETVPRDDLWAAQTPQAFVLAKLREAVAHASRVGLSVTDEAALFEALGWPVEIVPTTAINMKITSQEDLVLAEALIQLRAAVQPCDRP